MSVNGPLKGPGGAAPLTPETGALVLRPSNGAVAKRPVATERPQNAGGPPVRASSLPQAAGNAPQRRMSLPSTGAAPWNAHAMFPNGMPQGLVPPHADGQDPAKTAAQHVEQLTKTAEELLHKHIEATNKATDGVKDAVSPPSA